MTQKEIKIAAQELASVYTLMDKNPGGIDSIEKERLYSLAGQFPEIHYMARKFQQQRR